ncbi:MAG: lipoate--protein ligase family protein [Candidatus Helarchaeota archaeon]
MPTLRIIRDSNYPTHLGLAIDESLLLSVENDLSPDTIRFYYFSQPSVVIGRNQDIHDVNLEFLHNNNICLGRRLTGGGAILIGCPNYFSQIGISFLFNHNPNIPTKLSQKFRFFTSFIIHALQDLGLQPEYNKNSDISINGKKIAGNGIFLFKNSLLFHSIILFDFDFQIMLNVLNLNFSKSNDDLLSIMKNKITTLNIEFEQNISNIIVENAIIDSIKSTISNDVSENKLSAWELKTANKLLYNKYQTNNWNFQSLDRTGLMGACFVPIDPSNINNRNDNPY